MVQLGVCGSVLFGLVYPARLWVSVCGGEARAGGVGVSGDAGCIASISGGIRNRRFFLCSVLWCPFLRFRAVFCVVLLSFLALL